MGRAKNRALSSYFSFAMEIIGFTIAWRSSNKNCVM
jgi:hypothetical protein